MDLMVLKNNNSGILSIILKFLSLVSCDRNPDGECLINDRCVLFGKLLLLLLLFVNGYRTKFQIDCTGCPRVSVLQYLCYS